MRHLDRTSVLLAQHKQLRERIVDVGEASANVLASDEADLPVRASEMERAIGVFADEMRTHLATEEELLGPILERLDAWGPVRLDLLRSEHAHQRAVLHALHVGCRLGAREMARRARMLIADVLLDMDAEERDLLSEDLLRDDPIILDASDC